MRSLRSRRRQVGLVSGIAFAATPLVQRPRKLK